MAINIKNAQVEDSVRKLARKLGVDLTEAIGRAVEHELQRSASSRDIRLAKMKAVAESVKTLPVLDNRSDEELIGYDELGLPE